MEVVYKIAVSSRFSEVSEEYLELLLKQLEYSLSIFYDEIVDSTCGLINYHIIEISSSDNLIVNYGIYKERMSYYLNVIPCVLLNCQVMVLKWPLLLARSSHRWLLVRKCRMMCYLSGFPGLQAPVERNLHYKMLPKEFLALKNDYDCSKGRR